MISIKDRSYAEAEKMTIGKTGLVALVKYSDYEDRLTDVMSCSIFRATGENLVPATDSDFYDHFNADLLRHALKRFENTPRGGVVVFDWPEQLTANISQADLYNLYYADIRRYFIAQHGAVLIRVPLRGRDRDLGWHYHLVKAAS